MGWLERSKENLFKISEEKNSFIKACKEFRYVGIEDNENAEYNCELCNQQNIRYEYEIENNINLNRMIVGSECINKFIEHVEEQNEHLYDTHDNIVDIERLKDDKVAFLKNKTVHYLINNMNDGSFKEAIIKKITMNTPISVKQLAALKGMYSKITDKDVAYAMRKTIKISFKREIHKTQFDDLARENKKFVWLFLSNNQQKIIWQRYKG